MPNPHKMYIELIIHGLHIVKISHSTKFSRTPDSVLGFSKCRTCIHVATEGQCLKVVDVCLASDTKRPHSRQIFQKISTSRKIELF